jgi:hypothetical protein
MPSDEPLAFSRSFRVALPTFTFNLPQEVGGYSLIGAYPDELTLAYRDDATGASMDVTVSQNRYFYENDRRIGFPASLLTRKGVSGPLLYEAFAEGPKFDGLSVNPYKAIREGILARLRGDLGALAPSAKIDAVYVVGDAKEGQVWRTYRRETGEVALADGIVYKPGLLAIVSIRFEGPTPEMGAILKAFSDAVAFGEGDVKQNAALADACLTDFKDDLEPSWEAGCRQAHLVELFVTEPDTLPIAKRLYGEYLAAKNQKWIQALYDELHFDMHAAEGWEDLVGQMEAENPWLVKNPQTTPPATK